ncbi:MAG TPA: outer membrane protein transport protein, partial [Bacteroidia bacterium]
FPATTFASTLTLPSTTTLGFGYVVNEKLKLALDINYVGWKVYDTLSFNFAHNTSLLQDIHSPRCYKNVFIFRGGAQYQLKNNLFVRGGAYFDMSPAPDGYITPETPDANRIGITAGASWKATKKLNLDFSFLYIQSMKRTTTNLETGFSGTYQEKAIIPGIGLEFLF